MTRVFFVSLKLTFHPPANIIRRPRDAAAWTSSECLFVMDPRAVEVLEIVALSWAEIVCWNYRRRAEGQSTAGWMESAAAAEVLASFFAAELLGCWLHAPTDLIFYPSNSTVAPHDTFVRPQSLASRCLHDRCRQDRSPACQASGQGVFAIPFYDWKLI